MIFNSTIQLDKKRAIQRFEFFLSKGKTFELKEKHPKRSIRANSYLHLILTWFGLETGYTMQEVKQESFKKLVNTDMFYEGSVEGVVKIERWRSTASLDKEEMTLAITRFRNFSSKELGIYLPEPNDLVLLQELENEISKRQNQEFL